HFPPQRAIEIARSGWTGAFLQHPTAELVIIGQPRSSWAGRIAYRVHVAWTHGPGEVPFIRDAYVDAKSGRILRSLSPVYTHATPGRITSTDLLGHSVMVDITTYPDGTVLKDTVTLAQSGQIFTFDGSRNNILYQLPDSMSPISDPEAVSVAYN